MGIHASIPELVWTLSALVGAVFSVRALQDGWVQRQAALELDAAPGLLIIANGRLRHHAATLAAMVDFGAIGCYAISQPDPPHVTTGELLLTAVLVAAVAVLAGNAAADDRERVELRRYVERKHKETERLKKQHVVDVGEIADLEAQG